MSIDIKHFNAIAKRINDGREAAEDVRRSSPAKRAPEGHTNHDCDCRPSVELQSGGRLSVVHNDWDEQQEGTQ